MFKTAIKYVNKVKDNIGDLIVLNFLSYFIRYSSKFCKKIWSWTDSDINKKNSCENYEF